MLVLSLLTMPLSACVTTNQAVVKCPQLRQVPASTLQALAEKAKKDPETGAWLIDLADHRDKLRVCR